MVFTPVPGFEPSNYTPSDAAMKILDTVRPFVLHVFYATWCGDCEDHIPVFNAVMSRCKNSGITYAYHVVDRETRKDADRVCERFNSSKIPTFIAVRDNVELGRIVEEVPRPLECMLAEIAKN